MLLELLSTVLSYVATPHVKSSGKSCSELASSLNQMTPMRIDTISTWKSTVCKNSEKRTTLVYIFDVDVKKGEMKQEDLNRFKTRQLTSWCTNPEQLDIFKKYDVEYQYSDENGRFIGKLSHTLSECSSKE